MDYTDDEGIENVTELPKALSQADEPEIVNKKKLSKKAPSRKFAPSLARLSQVSFFPCVDDHQSSFILPLVLKHVQLKISR